MELTGQKWANIKQGSSIFGKTLISLRRLPFGVNVMLNLSSINFEFAKRDTDSVVWIRTTKAKTKQDPLVRYSPLRQFNSTQVTVRPIKFRANQRDCRCELVIMGTTIWSNGMWHLGLKAAKYEIQKTLNLARNIVSLQVWFDVSRFSPCMINLSRSKNICCGLNKVVAKSRARVYSEQQILALLLVFHQAHNLSRNKWIRARQRVNPANAKEKRPLLPGKGGLGSNQNEPFHLTSHRNL